MYNQAIILAGGMGTRLKSVVADKPKPMADVNGNPFLYYVLQYAQKQGISHVVLAVGYLHQQIIDYFGHNFNGITLQYSIEQAPLGTGGAIAQALDLCDSLTPVFIINGDTFFNTSLTELADTFDQKQADLCIALKEMSNFDRYGTVEFDQNQQITAFNEKQHCQHGFINAGIYLLKPNLLKPLNLPTVFSFEKEILEQINLFRTFTYPSDAYFIDIGIPADYLKAQTEIK